MGLSKGESLNNTKNYNKRNIYLINTLLIINYICYHMMWSIMTAMYINWVKVVYNKEKKIGSIFWNIWDNKEVDQRGCEFGPTIDPTGCLDSPLSPYNRSVFGSPLSPNSSSSSVSSSSTLSCTVSAVKGHYKHCDIVKKLVVPTLYNRGY